MGQPGRISLGQAVTPRGLVARPGYDRVTGPGSVTGHVTRPILGPASTLGVKLTILGDARGWWVGSVSLLIAETRMPTAGVEPAIQDIGYRIQDGPSTTILQETILWEVVACDD